ncbi:MAG: ankyrin repeat domain-containing protein [Treponema sp.]|nr:ankyrin repeat domain-containing protein [Treponema sp.]
MKKHIKIFAALFFVSAFIYTGCKTLPKNAQELIYTGNTEEAKKKFKTSKIGKINYKDPESFFERRQEPDDKDEAGNTALHVAVKMNNVEMVQFMLDLGASTTVVNNDGLAPIHVAIKNACSETATKPEENTQIILLLLQKGNKSDIYLQDNEGNTFIDLVATHQITDVQLYTDVINYLITDYDLANYPDENNQNVVHHFVKAKNEDFIYKITEGASNKASIGITLDRSFFNKIIPTNQYHGIVLDVQDKDGKTPLDLAYADIDDVTSVRIASRLILAKCRSNNSEFEYFEDAVKNRNYNLRSAGNKTPLHIACSKNHLAITEFLLDNKANPDVQDNDGYTPLHNAVRFGNPEIVDLLLNNRNKKADVNGRDFKGRTPLLSENKKETNEEIYNLLLKARADVTLKDIHGNTAFHAASSNGASEEILKKLYDAGADLNARNEDGATPLLYAVNEGHEYQIKFYISKNADIYATDKEKNSPLSRAFEKTSDGSNDAILKILVTNRNINTRDTDGNTPLYIAVTRKASMDCLEYLINCGADLDTRNYAGDTILHEVVRQDYRPAGELLIAKGANIFATNADGYSPLRIALERRGKTREWFCSPQVVLMSFDSNGNTPLHYAAEWRYNDSAIYLIEKKAEINKPNKYGETPLYSAIKNDGPDTLKLLIAYGADYLIKDYQGNSPLHYCINRDAFLCTQTLLETVAERSKQDSNELANFVDAKNLAGKTPLAIAAFLDNEKVAKILLDYGANVNESDVFGNSIVMDTVKSSGTTPSYKVMQLLVAKKVNVNAQNKDGRSAYHEVAELRDTTAIRMLSAAGGNALIRDNQCNTPFSIIVNKPLPSGYPIKDPYPLVDMLLGTDKKITDSNGNTPLHAAIYADVNSDIMKKLLIKYGDEIDRRNSQGLTALNYALSINQKEPELTLNQKELALTLIKGGANPFVKDDNNECALDIAFKLNDDEILEALVKNNLTRTDTEDNTILHYAARNQKADLLHKLVEWGLDKNARNYIGETPAKVADRWGNGSEARSF